MKRLFLPVLMLSVLTACASAPTDQAASDNDIYTDVGTPRPGVYLGIGGGSWGGRSGGGVGIGLGF